MNREEFEEYLISIGGVYDWRGNNTTNPSFFGVNEGWFMIVKNLISELLEFGWDRHMIQFLYKRTNSSDARYHSYV